jgi:hypothetical protein
MDAFAAFLHARPLLARILEPHGFYFVDEGTGVGSGGRFQRGAWTRDDGRRLEYSVRESLGDVVYRVGEIVLSHEAYTRGVAERTAAGAYPGFSSDAMDAFRHLASDLSEYGQPFLAGSDSEMQKVAARAEALAPARGFKALS